MSKDSMEGDVKVQCLSIQNPLSYLVCRGIKDVETRSTTTDYRGRVYVHSSGKLSYIGMPDMSGYPLPVIQEFNEVMAQIQEIEESSEYIAFREGGVGVYLKDEERRNPAELREYLLLSDVYRHYRTRPEVPFFLTNAIIGHVELVDVVRDHPSPWCGAGEFHWVFKDPVRLKAPISGVVGHKDLWEHSINDEDGGAAGPGGR